MKFFLIPNVNLQYKLLYLIFDYLHLLLLKGMRFMDVIKMYKCGIFQISEKILMKITFFTLKDVRTTIHSKNKQVM
jgi:hypothetical protein